MKKRKKRLTKFGKIFLTLVIISIITSLLFLYKDKLFKNYDTKSKYSNFITDESEVNKDKVQEYISKGMNIDNLKKKLNQKENYVNKPKDNYKNINYDFEKHLKYKELEKIYNNLNKSEIVKLEIIGTSVDGRNIYSIEIGKGTDVIMLEGNIHAAEIAPTLFLTKLAVDLVNDYEKNDKEIVELLTNHKILIVPSINPDGYDYSLFGREILNTKNSYIYKNDSQIEQDYFKANINGVDLNRKMPSQLSGLYLTGNSLYYTVSRTKSTKRLRYFPGEEVGSEPETLSLIYWMLKNYKNTHAYLSVHSAGRVIYNGKPHLSDDFNSYSKKCANLVNNYTDYLILGLDSEIDGDGTDGTSTDLIAEIAHGFKFSTDTGRLSTTKYDIKATNLEQKMCVATIETLEEYTQDLSIIKSEWENKNLKEAILAVLELEF